MQRVEKSEAYLDGWADASAMQARNPNYSNDPSNQNDYDLGYQASLADDCFNGE